MTGTGADLREERRGATAVLTLDVPERRNALSTVLRQQLLDAVARIEADRGVRAVVLTGAGGHFCSGGDITGMEVADLAEGRDRLVTAHRLVRALIKGMKPVVAAVEGWCAGAGVSLALCCDAVVASDEARFVASFNRIGLIADLGLMHTLPARVGQAAARRMLLEVELVDAARALAMGLVDQTVPAGSALDAALERAERFHGLAPLPLALTKQFLSKGLEEALDWEREAQASLYLTADHAEGRAAFLAKRAPVFKGT